MGRPTDPNFWQQSPPPQTGDMNNERTLNQRFMRELPGALPPQDVTIQDGAISGFASAALIVDTEGGAAADELDVINIVLSANENLHPGMLIILRAKDPARVVTVKNSAAANGINTADGSDIVLSPDWELTLRLVGGKWYEVRGRSSALAVEAQNAADNALAAAALAQSTATTAKAVTDKVTPIPSANAVPQAGVDGKLSAGWIVGAMYCNKRITRIASGIFTALVTGWYRIICIGAGGQGGGRTSTSGGAQGGATSFGSISARGGSGGGAGNSYGSGGGGEAGSVTVAYVYLTAGQEVSAMVGAGSSATSGTGQGAGPLSGAPGLVNSTGFGGGGASGAGSGGNGINGIVQGAVGGAGGQGNFGFGGGGGGAAGGGGNPGIGGAPGFGGVRPSNTSDIGGTGGNGAIIIEYFDPDFAG